MNGNEVTAVADGGALATTSYVADATAPELLSFSALMPDQSYKGINLRLSFNEAVDLTTLNVSGIVLQSSNTTLELHRRLTSGTASQSAYAPRIVELAVGSDDLAAIIALESIGREETQTHISLDRSCIADHAGNEPLSCEQRPRSPMMHWTRTARRR